MAITVNKIQDYMKNDFNILISGEAGTGKTYMLKKASENLGMKMKYYSAATLDPYADLVGIPVPQTDSKNVEFYRPRDIDEAEAVFFDEINRADPKTLNTIFELIQFRSINGEKLPNLRVVVAAMNPNDGNYTVDDLDMALVDRFDVYLESVPSIDLPYFKNLFGIQTAKAAQSFWNDYERNRKVKNRNSNNSMAYISPRRMEKIVATFTKLPSRTTIVETLPPGVNVSPNELYTALNNARIEMNKENQQNSGVKAVAKKVRRGKRVSVDDLIARGETIRYKNNRVALNSVISDVNTDDQDIKRLASFAATHLSVNVGGSKIVSDWAEVLERMTENDIKTMTAIWPRSKRVQFKRAVEEQNLSVAIPRLF